MRMNKVAQRVFSGVLAAALVFTSGVVSEVKASAASKYNCFLMYSDSTWKVTNFYSNRANTSVKNVKGTKHYTVTLTKGQCTPQNKTTKSTATAKKTQVFCVDVQNIIKDYPSKSTEYKKGKKSKYLKFSNVSIKVDGKSVKIKAAKLHQGFIEADGSDNNIINGGKVVSKGQVKNYRLDIYNVYNDSAKNGDKSACAKSTDFAFKKSISVSFDFTIKK
jgi:hypothetical protein